MTEAENQTEVQVPEGHIAIQEKFNFRRFEDTPANREKQLPSRPEHTIEVNEEFKLDENGNKTDIPVFKRASEVHTLIVPTPEFLGVATDPEDADSRKQSVVLQSIITDAISKHARKLVDEGKIPTPENCNWQLVVSDIYERVTSTGGTSGQTFSKEDLQEFAEGYAKYATDIGKPEEGIKITQKLITSRFNAMSVRKYVEALPLISQNIENYFADGMTEEEQAGNAAIVEYLLERITKAQEEPEQEDTSLF